MLTVISRDQAVALVREQMKTTSPRMQTVPLQKAVGRILAQDVFSSEDIPPFDRTTVDGYAVFAADCFGVGAASPVELEIVGEIKMGEAPAFVLQRGQCARIATGGMLPQGADAAVMVEHTENAAGLCLAEQSVSPGENVTRRGDDIAAGALALKKGTCLDAPAIGVLAMLGVYEVPVFEKPIVAVLSTGDEITRGTPQNGQMRDVNGFLLAAAAERVGCETILCDPLPDDEKSICTALGDCLQKADLVLISGGSSAGTRDLTVSVIEKYGEALFHGIAMKPGKPTIFGMAQGKPVFGLPGHPLAAYFVFRVLVCEALRELLCLPDESPIGTGRLAVNIPSNHGREEFLCVKKQADGTLLPLHTKSGIISVLTGADGFIRIPRDAEGLKSGTEIQYYKV